MMYQRKKIGALVLALLCMCLTACGEPSPAPAPGPDLGSDPVPELPEVPAPTEKEIKRISDFASVISEEGELALSWEEAEDVAKTVVKVSTDGETAEHELAKGVTEYTIDLQPDQVYRFEILPTVEAEFEDEIEYETMEFSRYYSTEVKSVPYPRVEIQTENNVLPTYTKISPPANGMGYGITDAEYVQTVVSVYDKDNREVYTSSDDGTDFSASKIKIRGNSSAYYEKNSLKIKLDKKADLFKDLLEGRTDKEYKNKNWVLLPRGQSLTQVVGTAVNAAVGAAYVTEHVYVELFLNGDYRGMYVLSESVEKGSGEGAEQSRVAIDDDGFIIEQDAYWWKEDLYFTTPYTEDNAMRYTFTEPDSDDITAESDEYQYIKAYVTFVEDLMQSKNPALKHYIDYSSFATWLLTHDYLGTYDCAGSNIYLTKKDSAYSPLCMGPTWDYDSIYTMTEFSRIKDSFLFYYPILLENEEFYATYKALFESTKDIIADAVAQAIAQMDGENYDVLLEYERARWAHETDRWASQDDTFEEMKAFAQSWFERKIEWLEENI